MPVDSSDTLATLFSIALNRRFELSVTVSPVLAALLAVAALLYFGLRWWLGRRPEFEIDTVEMGVGSGKISFKPNRRDQEIAYKIWVELSTRKIGLPIDVEHDVIEEVYDSWYNFFSVTRELVKDIPVDKVQNPSTRQIITLSINVLNRGLRPHLTTWRARFHRWYDRQLQSAADDLDPQSVQSKYPKYSELVADLMTVNGRLILYRQAMRRLVLGLVDEEDETTSPELPKL